MKSFRRHRSNMVRNNIAVTLILSLLRLVMMMNPLVAVVQGFVPPAAPETVVVGASAAAVMSQQRQKRRGEMMTTPSIMSHSSPSALSVINNNKKKTYLDAVVDGPDDDDKSKSKMPPFCFYDSITEITQKTAVSVALGLTVLGSTFSSFPSTMASAASTTDPSQIVGCLFQKCPIPLSKCILNPKCLANVICINTCTGKPDEINCQIQCGDIFENAVVGEFNKCVITDMECVPQQADTGQYPVPSQDKTVTQFNTNFFNGRLYITAGQNPLFDIFPCQVHFFTETEPGKFFGKLNWRVTEPDGEFFTRDALQEFYQDPNDPSHLINHDNEYLHYKDDWWIIDYEYDNNDKGVPPFAFVYYRGSNDAWDGYGGAVVYTRDAALPESLRPRLRAAAQKVNFDFDRDFTVTDNSCPAELSEGEKLLLREKFAGTVALQTEEQIQAQATRLRGNVVNSVKAQKLFFENRFDSASKAFKELEKSLVDFEKEVVK